MTQLKTTSLGTMTLFFMIINPRACNFFSFSIHPNLIVSQGGGGQSEWKITVAMILYKLYIITSVSRTSLFSNIWCNIYCFPYAKLKCILYQVSIILTSILRQIRGPESQVVSQRLRDQSAVLVWLFTQGVQLRNCLIESLLSQMAGPVSFSNDIQTRASNKNN